MKKYIKSGAKPCMKKIYPRLLLPILIMILLQWDCKSPTKKTDPKPRDNSFPPAVFFDDFNYENVSDPALLQSGWTIRNYKGGPGPSGASWDPEMIGFIQEKSNPENRLMTLSALTQGSALSCRQSEIISPIKYKKATFAAKVMFSDRPDYGTDGDGIVQTFFTISSWSFAETDEYSEFDFEYLPNGGWGRSGAHLWETSWEKVSDKINDFQGESFADLWQTLVIQADDSETRYYVNRKLCASHPAPYVVDGFMSINFNHWFIAEQLVSTNINKRQYTYLVDWVLCFPDSMMTPDNADSLVSLFRTNHYERYDNTGLYKIGGKKKE